MFNHNFILMKRSYYRNSNHGGYENKRPFFSKSPDTLVQTKKEPALFFQTMGLSAGRQGDKYEQEADSVADAVTSRSSTTTPILKKEISTIRPGNDLQRRQEDNPVQEKPEIQAMGFNEEEEPEALQMLEEEEPEDVQMMDEEETSITQQIKNTAGKGRQLPQKILAGMGSAFAADFSGVSIHTDKKAAQMSKVLHAQAFTHGNDIYFNSGKYNTDTSAGKHLLAHELTHVVQQGHARREGYRGKPGQVIQGKSSERETTNISPASSGATATTCGKPAKCPPEFCTPYHTSIAAMAVRAAAAPVLLAGIAAKVSPRVVPLWNQYFFGGASPQDLTVRFGTDFMTSLTTADTTAFLMGKLRESVTKNPPALPAGVDTAVIDMSPRLSEAINEIGTDGSKNAMNFNKIGEIPGNIAGGIGTTQLSCPVGARPSPFNDSREVNVKVIVHRNPDGTLTVFPFFNYTVKDTIDLCPGDCGAEIEKIATVPMSRMEASGISGDVPFTVYFPSMPVAPFTLIPSKPVEAKSNGEITASALRIRSKPLLSAKIIGRYLRGEKVDIICRMAGSTVLGNSIWYKTDKGFISGRYVSLKTGTPADC
jgi:hypothetical protein